MIFALVILNLVFAVFVVGAMLALHSWAIATDAGRQLRHKSIQRAPRTSPAQWRYSRPDLAAR